MDREQNNTDCAQSTCSRCHSVLTEDLLLGSALGCANCGSPFDSVQELRDVVAQRYQRELDATQQQLLRASEALKPFLEAQRRRLLAAAVRYAPALAVPRKPPQSTAQPLKKEVPPKPEKKTAQHKRPGRKPNTEIRKYVKELRATNRKMTLKQMAAKVEERFGETLSEEGVRYLLNTKEPPARD
jgi:hypothetical protein